jgi:acyl-CoA synthetase (AMP-forming)/AMP-acid ligase II
LTGPSQLTWQPAGVDPDVVRALTGAGAEFEIAREVNGTRLGFVRQPRNLVELAAVFAPRFADRVAMVDGDRAWSFRQAGAEAAAMAAVLRDRHGVVPGDRVAIAAANSPEHAIAIWATLLAGAVVVGLNGWWTGAELEYGVRLTEPRLILADSARIDRLANTDVPTRTPVVDLTSLGAMAAGQRAVADLRALEPDDPAVILFTSGTTGKPKGATLSHRNIVHYVWSSLLMGALAGAPVVPVPGARQSSTMATSPMFHLSGLLAVLMTAPIRGVRLVFAPPGRWSPMAHLQLSADHGVTTWGGVPTQYWRLMHHPELAEFDLSALQSIGVGGAPMPPELIREIGQRLPGVKLSSAYGMSETVGLGTRADGEEMLRHPASVGEVCPTVELEIRSADGAVVPEGSAGEICLRTGSVFLGYWNDPAATARALDDHGWYRTGDFGRVSGGRLLIDSRLRDLIIRAGENISPIEIEHRLIEHVDILDAAVVGIDHPELGQEVGAVIVLREGATITPDAVREWVGLSLATFKVPVHVEFRDSLPYTETGKVLKHEIEMTVLRSVTS